VSFHLAGLAENAALTGCAAGTQRLQAIFGKSDRFNLAPIADGLQCLRLNARICRAQA
jgi:hypothetical protein